MPNELKRKRRWLLKLSEAKQNFLSALNQRIVCFAVCGSKDEKAIIKCCQKGRGE
jgi:hypothetical protein